VFGFASFSRLWFVANEELTNNADPSEKLGCIHDPNQMLGDDPTERPPRVRTHQSHPFEAGFAFGSAEVIRKARS
jgi:hypothetical protein